MRDVAVGVVLVVGHCRAAAQLLRELRQVVGIIGVVCGGHVVVYGAVTAGYGYVGRQAENVLGAVRRVLYGRLVVESSASVPAERALVAVLVRLQFAVVAGEIVFVPCLRGYHAVGRTFILEVCRVAQRYERRRTVAAQFRLRREGVVVAVGRQEIAVVLVPCLGVLVAFAVLHGCAGEVALHIVVGNVVFLDRLAVDRIVAFGVEVLGDNLAEAEELALVAVSLSVAVLEGRRHDGAVVMTGPSSCIPSSTVRRDITHLPPGSP